MENNTKKAKRTIYKWLIVGILCFIFGGIILMLLAPQFQHSTGAWNLVSTIRSGYDSGRFPFMLPVLTLARIMFGSFAVAVFSGIMFVVNVIRYAAESYTSDGL